MNKLLKKIVDDNTSGSTQLLLQLINLCQKNLNNLNRLKNICTISKNKLSCFANINNFIYELEKHILIGNPQTIKSYLIECKQNIINAGELIYHSNKKLFDKINSFTTISYSKTLLELVKFWSSKKENLRAYIIESRPNLEGRFIATEFSKLNIDTVLLVDTMMAYAVNNSDAVIIGADKILKNGNVINKIGSYPLAILAREFNKPFYVVAIPDKYVNEIDFRPKNYPSYEIWKTRKKIKIINYYFEEVPKKFITKVIS